MLTREYSSFGMPVLVSGVLAFALFHAQQHPRIQDMQWLRLALLLLAALFATNAFTVVMYSVWALAY